MTFASLRDRWVKACPSHTGLASGRLSQTLRDHDIKGERGIAIAQAVISCFILILHLYAQLRNGTPNVSVFVVGALAALIASSAVRLAIVRSEKLPERQLDALNIVDLSVFLLLIWTYQYAHDHPAAGVLKSPSFILLFVMISLRALRFHPRPIIISGATAVVGWGVIVAATALIDGWSAVTRDYPTYLTSYKIFFGAEIEKFVGLVALTLFLVVATYKGRVLLSRAAHADDYEEALNTVQSCLEKAESAQQRFNAVFNNAENIIYLKKPCGEMVHVNDRFCEQFGLKKEEVIGRADADIFGQENSGEWRENDQIVLLSPETFRYEEMLPNRDGTKSHFITSKFRIYDPVEKENVICVLSTDITQQKAAEEKIRQLAFFDKLTGLPNRTCCKKDILEKLENSGPDSEFALIHLDLDNFKRVNDSKGHSAGDALLSLVGWRLRLCLGNEGKAYRWGGDEFVILVEGKPDEELADLCEEITDLLSVSFNYKNTEIWPTASLGVARYPKDGTTFDALMIYADLALYKSKQKGRDNFHFFTRELKEKVDEEALIESELRIALENEELFLVYQPQISVRSLEVTGVEVLVRWNHPQKGVLAPGEFLGVVESSRLAPMVGQFVFDKAFEAARCWLDNGLHFGRIAVNLSPAHFQLGMLVDDFLDSMSRYGIEAQYVAAEVVESLFLGDPASNKLDMLDHLHKVGVHIELDDFGTGYASLTHLTSLPIDGLKIDRAFTNQMLSDEKMAVVTKSIIDLAQQLNMRVVCEGIETEEQLGKLLDFGDFSAQGYLFSRPMPFDKMTDWFKTRMKSQSLRPAKVAAL